MLPLASPVKPGYMSSAAALVTVSAMGLYSTGRGKIVKKTYVKPELSKRSILSTVTAAAPTSAGT